MPPGPEHRQAEEVDVLVMGAGLAGLTTALALTGAGASVRVIDAADAPSAAADLRSTALFPTSVALLEKLGIWRGLVAAAAAIRRLQIVDRAPPGRRPRQATFKASEIQADELAYNVPNPALRLALEKAASGAPRLQLSRPARLASLARREDAVIAQLQDGTAIRARLLVAADGRNSETRRPGRHRGMALEPRAKGAGLPGPLPARNQRPLHGNPPGRCDLHHHSACRA